MTKDVKASYVLGSAIAIGMIVSVCVGSYSFIKVRAYDDSLSVTGSAKKAVISDKAKWTPSFSRTVKESSIKDGYAKVANDLRIVKDFLLSQGFNESEITIAAPTMEQFWEYKNDGNNSGEQKYTIRQSVEVASDDVKKVANATKNVASVASKSVLFTMGNVEYFYSKLPELRITLISDAVKDAKARAEQIALSGERRVGALKSAASGVVQVLPANSIDISDYGMYDTSSINKDVMVTVRAAFSIQ
jgi:hypothetical protein